MMTKQFWLRRILASEFGTSDIQSRYSRVYIWLANQFGHATLGLLTVLAFTWLNESTADLVIISLSDTTGHWTAYVIEVLIFAACMSLTAAHLLRFFNERDRSELDQKTRRPELVRVVRTGRVGLMRQSIVGFNVSAFLAIWVPLATFTNFAAFPSNSPMLLPCLLFWSGALLLSRETYVTILATVAMAAIGTIGMNVTTLLPMLLGGVFIGVLFYSSALKPVGWVAVACGVLAYAGYHLLNSWPVAQDWEVAISGTMAGVTFWLVKEFGSDIPLVDEELRVSDQERQRSGQPQYPHLALRYFKDAVVDARTDGAFYFLGAVVGAGVSTSAPLLAGSTWASGAEIAGLIIFVAGFLVISRRWLLRQEALDAIEAPYTNRLATYDAPVRMWIVGGDRPVKTVRDPLNRLFEFATGKKLYGGDEDTASEISHLVVFGGPRSGKTPLGVALCCEAAITDIPLNGGKSLLPADERRRANFTTLSAFLATQTGELEAEGMFENQNGSQPGTNRVVSIDDLRVSDVALVGRIVKMLRMAQGLTTVWLVGCDVQHLVNLGEGSGVPDELSKFAESLVSELESVSSGVKPRLKLGVAVVGNLVES